MVPEALAMSLDKRLERPTGFFFGNTELSMELWTVVTGLSEFDDQLLPNGDVSPIGPENPPLSG